ncbi:MAG: hypothetical protein IPJ87_03560 [Flavobacteriales bacterium]|nr:hypothetical protein [Flavobacteriales bacterium]MBK7940943.1 hypothetical protein [Flavobacteriales bacterium]MBK9701634.1 hypothetical protein [Flavobacteriales bacterium]
MTTLRTQLLVSTVVLVGMSIAQNPCKDVLVVHREMVNSHESLVRAVRDYQSSLQSSSGSTNAGFDFSVILPTEVPIPVGGSGSFATANSSFEQQVRNFESSSNWQWDKYVEISFVPANQTAAWLECVRTIYQSTSPGLQVKGPRISGHIVTIDVGLGQNMQPAVIKSCRIKSAGVEKDMKALLNLDEIQAGTHSTIPFEVTSTDDDFYFELATDKYAPVIVYLTAIAPPPPPCQPPTSLNANAERNVNERIALSEAVYLKTGEQILVKLDFQVTALHYCPPDKTRPNDGWNCVGAYFVIEKGEKEFDRITVREPSPDVNMKFAARDEFRNVLTYQASESGWYSFKFFYNISGRCDGGLIGETRTNWDRFNLTLCH